MVGRLLGVVLVLVVVFAAAQLVRPARTNPRTNPAYTIEARYGPESGLAAVLSRGCGDCHSNATAWARYTNVAPLSWVIASVVAEGRKAVNFSEWANYPPERQRALLAQSCQDASAGKMPPAVFTAVRPEARLSARDVQLICAAAEKA